MKKLTTFQEQLLAFMRLTPSPSVQELRSFAQVMQVDERLAHHDLIGLIYERLIRPAGEIDRTSYLPSMLELSAEGKAQASDCNPMSREEEKAWAIAEIKRRGEATVEEWPAAREMSKEDFDDLLSAYLYWGKMKGGVMSVDSRHLARAAVQGYYEAGRLESFRDALRTWIGQEEDSFDLHEFLIDFFKMNRFTGRFGDEVRLQAAEALSPIYWKVTSELLPELTSAAVLEEHLGILFDRLEKIGSEYKLTLPDPDALEITNRLSDLMYLAFKLQSKDVYQQVVSLLESYLQLCGSMLQPQGDAQAFDRRAGYGDGVQTAVVACGYLAGLQRLVELPDEPRKDARVLTGEVIRYAMRMVVAPAVDKARGRNSEVWLCRLLDRTIAREELVAKFEKLYGLLKENGTPVRTVPGALIVSESRLDELMLLVVAINEKLSRMEGHMGALVSVFMNQMSLVSQNDEALRWLCEMVASSQILLDGFDQRLAGREQEIREDVARLQRGIDSIQGGVKEEKEAIQAALSKLASQKSLGKMVVEIPLIPLFLKYKKESDIKVDVKRWYSTLF